MHRCTQITLNASSKPVSVRSDAPKMFSPQTFFLFPYKSVLERQENTKVSTHINALSPPLKFPLEKPPVAP